MMPDREKVIKAVEDAFDLVHSDFIGTDDFNETEWEQNKVDALSLLKEQEPKQVEAEVINEIDRLYRCPSCHISMIIRKQPYCHSCGQAVKWG